MNKSKIIEVFPNQRSANEAFQYALSCGYSKSDIDVIMSEDYYQSTLKENEHSNTMDDIGKGGAAGGTIGGILGALFTLGVNIALPGIGLIIAGPLAGVVAGSLMGTLLGLGISEAQTQEYEESLKEGAIILSTNDQGVGDLKEKWKQIKDKN